MNTVSPVGNILPFPAAQPPVADAPVQPAEGPSTQVVKPVSEVEIIGPKLPHDTSAETVVMALANANSSPNSSVADRVSSALSASGMHVVSDGVRAPAETDAFGKPTEASVTLLDSLPDRVPAETT